MNHKIYQNQYGITLVEVLAAVALLTLVFSVVFLVMDQVSSSWTTITEKEKVQEESRIILDHLVRATRNTSKSNFMSSNPNEPGPNPGFIQLIFPSQSGEGNKRIYWDNTADNDDPFPQYTFAIDPGDGNYLSISKNVSFFSWEYIPDSIQKKGIKYNIELTTSSGNYQFSAATFFQDW
ncbi:prepilin-type N-terminal cleavage/methylation domain-containing protein [Microaerobacter geothermalis]|uniref:PilW family protein n=1 Tax=Microaerobacter geothermalis TaxID=674972 RepID=UPI001F3EF4F5|nr:prepilin-type N-terminal cleavage/methylation domain-containing protein [Microaerobacter geothermalis]MCF6092692.1 prepilin-type N-terminal cleavage/methylation domain-containing protein [Microaerobacter geothermalis]